MVCSRKNEANSGDRGPERLMPDEDEIRQISTTDVDFFKPILDAISLGAQISNLKKLLKELSEQRYQIVSIIAVQWWFNLPFASPVRRAISGCFNQVDNKELRALVEEQIATRIKNDCSGENQELSREIAIKNIQRCLENFSSGEKGVLSEIKIVTEFLLNYIQEKVELVCEEDVSPTEKADATDHAVGAIRVLVPLVKDLLRQSSTTTLPTTLKGRLADLCDGIMRHNDLPLDLRSNAGIIYVAILQQHEVREKLKLLIPTSEYEGLVVSLCHGLLSCLNITDLLSQGENQASLLQLILHSYLEVAKSAQETTTVLACSRGLLSWSCRLIEACKSGLMQSDNGPETIQSVLEFSWSHLEHSIDSVRHNAREFIKNSLIGLQLLNSEESCGVVDRFLGQSLALPAHKRARFASLSCLVKTGSLPMMLKLRPQIRTEILGLADEYALVGPISELYDSMIKADFVANKDDIHLWYKGSVQPLLNQLESSDSLGPSQLSKNLLNKSTKLYPGLIDLIFREESNLCGKLAIYCLKLGRDLGNPWQFLKHRSLIEKSMRSGDEEERLQAFNLLVVSHSSVEPFSMPELVLMKEFVERNLALPSPAGRQVFLSNCKNMLTRLRDGAKTIAKKLSNRKHETESCQLQATLTTYSSMLVSLMQLLFSNLFDSANLARRSTVLEMLTQVNEILNLSSLPSWCHIEQSLTESAARRLYRCLWDSYENNKLKALNILKALPPHLLGLTNPDCVGDMLDETVALINSRNPSHCLTAGYTIKLLLTAPAATWVFADRLGIVEADTGKLLFYAAVFMRNMLAEQVHLAQTDLLTAAADKPMYGVLHVIRAIFSELKEVHPLNDWVELVADLESLGYAAWGIVKPVVASDSPEGHLPMDNTAEGMKRLQQTLADSKGSVVGRQTYRPNGSLRCAAVDPVVVSDVFADEIIEELIHDIIDETVGNGSVGKSDIESMAVTKVVEEEAEEEDEDSEEPADLSEIGLAKAKEVSSQMLLLCAWRTVKELSLFLSELCDRDATSRLVTSSQILNVSSFLMDLLAQTKHRGAFEQAYVAFTKLCACLWRSSEVELHSHPLELLQELMSSIGADDNGGAGNGGSSQKPGLVGLCATRRSAGVPFIVQAILSTEPPGLGSGAFKTTMQRLLALAGSGNGRRDTNLENRVHACNVLRALFRDTTLGEYVAGFIEEGLQVAINGFEASNWAERNAATLLFSALMTRIFGVQREKDSDELSSKNCLTGKVFFQRYPSSHALLHEKLEKAASYAEAGTLRLHPALYPVLLVLSRIFPSPSEALDNPFKLSSLVPLVEACTGSPVLAIRKLAARALVPLISQDQLDVYGKKLIDRLEREDLPSNHVHGILLTLCRIKQSVASGLFVLTANLLEKLVSSCKCPLISSQFISLVNMEDNLNQEDRDLVVSVISDKLSNVNESFTPLTSSHVWRPNFLQECSDFMSKSRLSSPENPDISGSLLQLFINSEVEVRKRALSLYKAHLDSGGVKHIEKADIFNLILGEKQDVCLHYLVGIFRHCDSSLFTLSDLTFFMSFLQVKESEDLVCVTLHLCGQILVSLASLHPGQLPWLEFGQTIKGLGSVEQTAPVRLAVVNTLKENLSLLTRKPTSSDDRVGMCLLWSALIETIYSSDEEIRSVALQINHSLTGDFVTLELAARSLVGQCFRHLGRMWPAAAVLVVLGHIVTNLIDADESRNLEVLDNDKAFDKGEVDTYRELETTSRSFLPQLSLFLDQLSVKKLEAVCCEQLPSVLVVQLLPPLPAGVIVYSINQLVEYFQAFERSEPGEQKIWMSIQTTLQERPSLNTVFGLSA